MAPRAPVVGWTGLKGALGHLDRADRAVAALNIFTRKQSVTAAYAVWKATALHGWKSVNDIVLVDKLGYHAALDPQTFKLMAQAEPIHPMSRMPVWDAPFFDATEVAQIDGDTAPAVVRCGFHPNNFPYELDSTIIHRVLWCDAKLSTERIEALLQKLLPHRQYIWFENIPSRKSLPGVFHVQVFIDAASNTQASLSS